MKKLIISFIGILILTGCSKDNSYIYPHENGYYNVAIPYKSGVSNHYIINNMNTYDIDEVETSLMEISSFYFPVDTSYYQDGQYLNNDFLKEILNKDHLNNYPVIEIDGVKINPYYLTSIVEQNYLDSSGNLKGISLGLILNPFQSYQNSYGVTLYKSIKEDELLKIGLEITKKLLEKVRTIENLSKTKIVIALYIQNSPNANTKGSYKKYGMTVNNDIAFKDYKEETYYISSDYVMRNNNDIHNFYLSLEKSIKELIPKLYVSGNCNYKNSKLESVIITISGVRFSKSDVLALTQMISNDLDKKINVNLMIYMKESNTVKAILEKAKDEKLNIHILEGI